MERPEKNVMHPAHERVWELLPFHENGSLSAAEAREVEAHLGECLVCRREVGRLELLAEAVAVTAEEHACAQAYRRLSERIAASGSGSAGPLGWLLAGLRNLLEPVPLAAGAVLLVALAGCAEESEVTAEAGYQPNLDMHDFMGWVLDPLADVIWSSAGTITTFEGSC